MAEFGTVGSAGTGETMNNKALKSMIDAVGDRMCIIKFDGNNLVYIGYPSSNCKSVQDLQLRTVDGVDLIGIQTTTHQNHREEVKFTTWHPTATVYWVGIMDEGYETKGIDPYTMH